MREEDPQKRQAMLRKIFDGYNASSDGPGMCFVDDLLDMYPNARVISNKRATPEEWVESVRSTLAYFYTWQYHLLTYWVPTCYWHHQIYVEYARLAKRRYGVDDMFSAECYNRHNEWVHRVATTRGKEVLEWTPEDGWEPLCKFLGRQVPNEAFPRTNETAEIHKLTAVLIKKGLRVWAGVLSVVAITAAAGRYIARLYL